MTKRNCEAIFDSFPQTELWRLCIPGNKQDLGMLAYDGLPEQKNPTGSSHEPPEPGYLEGSLMALQFIRDNIDTKLSSDLIERLHIISTINSESFITAPKEANKIKELVKTKMLTDIIYKNFGQFNDELFYRNGVAANFGLILNKNLTPEGLAEIVELEKSSNQNAKPFLTLIKSSPTKKSSEKIDTFPLKDIDAETFVEEMILSNQNKLNIGYRLDIARITRKEAQLKVESLITILNDKMKIKDDKEYRLNVIVEFVRNLEITHSFSNGNTRVIWMILTLLLLKNGFVPAILEEPGAFKGLSVEQLVSRVNDGMEKFRSFMLSNHAITLLNEIDSKNVVRFKETILKLCSIDPIIALAQLNDIYIKISKKNSGITNNDKQSIFKQAPDLSETTVPTLLEEMYLDKFKKLILLKPDLQSDSCFPENILKKHEIFSRKKEALDNIIIESQLGSTNFKEISAKNIEIINFQKK